MLGRHALAVVADADDHPFFALFGNHIHFRGVGRWRLAIAAGILKQVGDDAGQFHLVGQNVEVIGHVHGDLQLAVILHRIDAGCDHCIQIHRAEHDAMVGAGVVQEFVDGGVQLHDVGHHVFARHVVIHAHFRFKAQARQRRAQVVGDTGQHHGAVLLQLGQFFGHTVEADIDLADFAGHGFFVEMAGVEVTLAHSIGGIGQLFERPVDQPRNGSRPREREQGRCHQPDQPCLPAGGGKARLVHQHPVPVPVDGEAHPQALLSIHTARHYRAVA